MELPLKVSLKQLKNLEENVDEKGLSNFTLIQHYVKGKGTYIFRVVCEFQKEEKANEKM